MGAQVSTVPIPHPGLLITPSNLQTLTLAILQWISNKSARTSNSELQLVGSRFCAHILHMEVDYLLLCQTSHSGTTFCLTRVFYLPGSESSLVWCVIESSLAFPSYFTSSHYFQPAASASTLLLASASCGHIWIKTLLVGVMNVHRAKQQRFTNILAHLCTKCLYQRLHFVISILILWVFCSLKVLCIYCNW